MRYVTVAGLLILCCAALSITTAQGLVPQLPDTSTKTYRLIRFGSMRCPPCKEQQQIFDAGGVPAELARLKVKNFYYDVGVGNNSAYAKLFKLTYTPSAFLCEELPNGRLRVLKKWGGAGYDLMTAEQFKTFVNPNKPGPDPAFIRQRGLSDVTE